MIIMTKDQNAVGMLLAALQSANCYNRKDAISALLDAGMTWANAAAGSDQERAAWRAVGIAAEWHTA
jgi:hypothetical protein